MTETKLLFTARVRPMFGNIDIESMDESELESLVASTYGIPTDCIESLEVRK